MEHETGVSIDRGRPGSDPGAAVRGHRALAHTADAGLEAWAPDPAALLEEAAVALGEIAADLETATTGVEPGEPPQTQEELAIEAPDPEGLVFAWLNELIGLVDARGAAIAAVAVRSASFEDTPHARATVRLVRFDGRRVRRRSDVKSATYHRLAVRRVADGWSLVAYLDI